jgi:hypothetical protein
MKTVAPSPANGTHVMNGLYLRRDIKALHVIYFAFSLLPCTSAAETGAQIAKEILHYGEYDRWHRVLFSPCISLTTSRGAVKGN